MPKSDTGNPMERLVDGFAAIGRAHEAKAKAETALSDAYEEIASVLQELIPVFGESVEVEAEPEAPKRGRKPKAKPTPEPEVDEEEETFEEEDDLFDDEPAPKKKSAAAPKKVKVTRDVLNKTLKEYANDIGFDEARQLLQEVCGVTRFPDIPEEKYQAVYDRIMEQK